MKFPKLSLRRSMLLVALTAVGCFLASEFRDGVPPRFVIRGIPARIARLKPGMTWRETKDILGLETGWIRGGTDAHRSVSHGNGRSLVESYPVGLDGALNPYGSRGVIVVSFETQPGPLGRDHHAAEATRLTHATFAIAGKTIAEMPGGR